MIKDFKDLYNNSKCVHYSISRLQRKHEIDRGDGLKGTSMFDEVGCYLCNGKKTSCSQFTTPYELYIGSLKRNYRRSKI